jgi:hypothetical protein
MEVEFFLPPDPEVVGVARAALARLMRDFPDEVTDTMSLLVTELIITNSHRHSDMSSSDRIV